MCFILHHWLPWVPLSSWPRWKVLVIFFALQATNVTVPALVFLDWGWSLGCWSWGMTPVGRAVWESFLSMASSLLHHAELGGLFAESTHLSCRTPVCQSLLFLARGRDRNALCISWLCSQAEEFSMTPDLWGLPGKTHAYSDMRLWNGAPVGESFHHY